jgi:transposase
MSAPREGFVISLEEWVDIVALHRQGLSIKAIARRLGVSRNAVRRALRRDGPPVRAPQRRPPSKLEPFKDYLLARLAEFPELSTVVLFEEIQAQGYTGGLTILRNFTRPYRVRRREPVVRFETPPGRQAQVDWAHLGIHVLDGVLTPLYLFVMILGFSRALYAEVVTSTDVETFLRLHVRAFESFGGIPEEILYDNQKQVVLARTADGPRFHPEFLSFCGQFGFRPRLCRPYRARTKGKVERSIGYVKDRFFCGRTFTDLADMNDQLAHWLSKVANEREHATTGEAPSLRLTREGLRPLAEAKPWHQGLAPSACPKAPLFRIVAPEVEERSLSVYEEVAV